MSASASSKSLVLPLPHQSEVDDMEEKGIMRPNSTIYEAKFEIGASELSFFKGSRIPSARFTLNAISSYWGTIVRQARETRINVREPLLSDIFMPLDL